MKGGEFLGLGFFKSLGSLIISREGDEDREEDEDERDEEFLSARQWG